MATWAAKRNGFLANKLVSGDAGQTRTPALSFSERETENDPAVASENNALNGRTITIQEGAS
jgi:hypothetical protein